MLARRGDASGDHSPRQRPAPHQDKARAPAVEERVVADDRPVARRLFELHQAVGNRAVTAALAHVQRSPDDKAVQAKSESPGGDLELPWSWSDTTAFELTSSGIRFLIAVAKTQAAAAKASVPSLAARIAADNAAIADPSRRVLTCFITSGTTRFAYWGTRAVLMLDPMEADLPTAAHEMGHAVMDGLVHAQPAVGKATGSGASTPVPERIADLYLRMQGTRARDDSSAPAGLMMVDPSEWSAGAKSEHPWENADEYFASAKAAFQANPKGLAKAIARATKVDPAVGPPAKELLALLDAIFGKATMPTDALSGNRAKAATAEVARFKSPSQIEDTVALHPQLGWLIDPKTRPRRR